MQVKDLIPVSNVNLIFLRQIVYSDFFYFFFISLTQKNVGRKNIHAIYFLALYLVST